ncbi:DMT family transporter [Bacillus tianshenii]|nr:DMT family transporter [Bacillus tianshenii]
MNKKYVYLLPVLAALFWGGNFVIGRGFSETMPPFTLAFLRWCTAFLFFLPFGWHDMKTSMPLFKRHWQPVFWLSLTGIVIFNSFVYIAVHFTTSINAALINAPAPVFIMLLSFLFLKERLAWQHIVGFIFSLIGVLFIISRGSLEVLLNFSINKGELWMVAAVIDWAIYSVLVKKYAPLYPAKGLFLVTMAVGAMILAPFSAYEWLSGVPMTFGMNSIFGILYLGVFASVAAFLSWNSAVALVGPGKASPFLNLIPMFASFFAVTFLGESLQWSQLAGGSIVIIGVLITTGVLKFRTKSTMKQESYLS